MPSNPPTNAELIDAVLASAERWRGDQANMACKAALVHHTDAWRAAGSPKAADLFKRREPCEFEQAEFERGQKFREERDALARRERRYREALEKIAEAKVILPSGFVEARGEVVRVADIARAALADEKEGT